MNTISVMVRRSSDQLRQRLELESAFFKKLPFCYRWIDCGSAGKALAFTPDRPADPTFQKELVEALASLLTGFIIEDLKPHLLEDLIRCCHFYFSKEERRKILALACRDFECKTLHRCFGFYRNSVEGYLQDYLSGSPVHLNIEGFYNFRMRGFRRELWRVLDDAIDIHLAEKEHREFVRLLKYFLNLQLPGVDLVHLTVDAQGRFKIMDRRFKQIDPREWKEFGSAGFDSMIDYEDILVSMLVSMAPRRIMLHQSVSSRYPRAVKSLRSVFEERLIFCKNCAWCRRGKIHLVTGDRNRRPDTS